MNRAIKLQSAFCTG